MRLAPDHGRKCRVCKSVLTPQNAKEHKSRPDICDACWAVRMEAVKTPDGVKAYQEKMSRKELRHK